MEISYHYPICLEWDDCITNFAYPFKFNRAWLLNKEFSQIVNNSWMEKVPCSVKDDLRSLIYKLKRLKGVVKIWEKS